MLYITKTVILYFHLVLTKGTLRYADLYNHEKDQSPLLYMKKDLEIYKNFIEKSYFIFIVPTQMNSFFVLPIHL